MYITMPQIIKFTDSSKTQKSRYFENQTLFLQITKNYFLNVKGYNTAKT